MSTYLDVRTAVQTVERALVEALSLAYQLRHTPVQDLDALQALPSTGQAQNTIPPRALRFVRDEGVVYRWQVYSGNAAAPPYVILPLDRSPTSKGRWERQESAVTFGPNHYRPVHRVPTGYARLVQPWQGDEGDQQAIDRIFGQSPAFLVRWMGDELTLQGSMQGALYQVDMPFEIWCFARNLRADWEALRGSPIEAEAQAEPGLWRMMGDVRYVLAGSQLGLGAGVRYLDIQGTGRILEEDLAERKFVGVVPLTVKASYNIPDEDLVPLDEVWIQHEDAGAAQGQAVADPQNYLAAGGRLDRDGTLVGQLGSPIVAYVGGELVTAQVGPRGFDPDRDTYRDLMPDGRLIFTAVPAGDPAPLRPDGALRLGATRTDGAAIVSDTLLCGYSLDQGEPYRAV